MTTIIKTILEAASALNAQSTSPRVDAEILLAHLLNVSRAYIYSYPETELQPNIQNAFQSLLQARIEGIPIAYLIGQREFWSLPLLVTKDTLIPRPETELLVEKALEQLPTEKPLKILELGTGSGAIACALAQSQTNWQITASDMSLDALNIAKQNASNLNLSNITFVHSNWFRSIPEGNFDAILSNPPYLANDDSHLMEGDLRFEPKLALVSGPNGLESLQSIIEQSYNRLVTHGILLLEHGFQQRQAVAEQLSINGYQNIRCWQDFQGHDRVSGAMK